MDGPAPIARGPADGPRRRSPERERAAHVDRGGCVWQELAVLL